MKAIITIIIMWISIVTFNSCDPAHRLKVINNSGTVVDLKKMDLYPIGLHLRPGIDSLGVVSLDSIQGYEYIEFYGIGGWNTENAEIMRYHLDSVISLKLNTTTVSTFELDEFGNSLMIYVFQ